jgi:hypothetical protein
MRMRVKRSLDVVYAGLRILLSILHHLRMSIYTIGSWINTMGRLDKYVEAKNLPLDS